MYIFNSHLFYAANSLTIFVLKSRSGLVQVATFTTNHLTSRFNKCVMKQIIKLYSSYLLLTDCEEWIDSIGCLISHSKIFQLYMWRHIDVQADWRRRCTCIMAPNVIDFKTCPSKRRHRTTLLRLFWETASFHIVRRKDIWFPNTNRKRQRITATSKFEYAMINVDGL